MCCSLFPASFDGLDGTTVIFSRALHPDLGRYVDVLVYQNSLLNLIDGPNAMILHFPAHPMNEGNVVNTDNAPNIAQDCVRAIDRRNSPLLSFGPRELRSLDEVHVFDSGIYTVVLAKNPRDIPAALSRVPAHKRPPVNQEIFDFYAELRRGWPMALCCFDSRAAGRATPMMWWYDPLDFQNGSLPGIDAHDGHAPDMAAQVLVKHWALMGMNLDAPGMMATGATAAAIKMLSRVNYTDMLTPLQRALLPTHVMGRRFEGMMANGDFVAPIHAIAAGDTSQIRRGLIDA